MRCYLRELRAGHSLTQQNVADKLGITNRYYSAIEAGRRQADMKNSMIDKLAAVFGVTGEDVREMEADYQAERAATLQAQGIE